MTKPIAWTIAGTDPSGGAGIQADLKTMNALGVHGCSVITALVAQNTQRVSMIEFPSEKMLSEQMTVLIEDLPPAAIKIGMLHRAVVVKEVSRVLADLDAPVVYDPVMASSSGAALLEPAAYDEVRDRLLPRVDLLTPNLDEAAALTGLEVVTPEDMERAAAAILKLGAKAVLVKGGHLEIPFSQDFWTNGARRAWLTNHRQDTKDTHGSGCTFSSAIAACLALGYDMLDAIVVARAYVNQGIRTGGGVGSGRGPVAHGGWPANPQDLPWLTDSSEGSASPLSFPDCGPEPVGFYPLVDSTEWLERLLPLGVKTIQLRIKDTEPAALEKEIRRAIELARHFNCRLFINDFWQLALKHGAYGVHLGQKDLATADLAALASAKLRLGVSTHSYTELARVRAYGPSYIAIGTVFPTSSKPVDHIPLGLGGLARLQKLSAAPIVAIGGITLEKGPEVLDAGAEGIAVISDVTQAPDVEQRVRGWLQLFDQRFPSE